MKDKLYHVLDYILNHAGEDELRVVEKSVHKRREALKSQPRVAGVHLDGMADSMAEKVSRQVGASEEQIRNTVRGFAEEIIRKNAPELSDEQVAELLGHWVPRRGGESGAPASGPADPEGPSSGIPGDVLLQMVRQFISYSTGGMSAGEQIRMREELGEWPDKYWQRFDTTLRGLITAFLKGRIGDGDFEKALLSHLGL